MIDGLSVARKFHEAYERMAPSFGYETQKDTKVFDPKSHNGQLMIAVCEEVVGQIVRDAYAEGVKTGYGPALDPPNKQPQKTREQLIAKLHQLCKEHDGLKLPKGWESVTTNELEIFYRDAMDAAGTSDPWEGWDAYEYRAGLHVTQVVDFGEKQIVRDVDNDGTVYPWKLWTGLRWIVSHLFKFHAPARLAILSTIPPELVAAAKGVKNGK